MSQLNITIKLLENANGVTGPTCSEKSVSPLGALRRKTEAFSNVIIPKLSLNIPVLFISQRALQPVNPPSQDSRESSKSDFFSRVLQLAALKVTALTLMSLSLGIYAFDPNNVTSFFRGFFDHWPKHRCHGNGPGLAYKL